MLTVTSTIIAIIVVVVLIYPKKSGNCFHGKHLQNNRKNKKTDLNEFELIEINKLSSISISHPLTHRLTVNSCHSLAQRQLPQLHNTIQDQPNFLEDAGLEFLKYDKFKHGKRRIIDPS